MINALTAPSGSKVWVLEINESKNFGSNEVSIGGVFSSRENAMDFLANAILGDEEELFASLKWKQSKHNAEFFEGVDTEGIEYQIHTTTVDEVRFDEKIASNCYLCRVDDPNEIPFDPATHGICIIHGVALWELADKGITINLRGSSVTVKLEQSDYKTAPVSGEK